MAIDQCAGLEPLTTRKTTCPGRCSPVLAEELSKETSVTVAQAYEILEDLARRFPELITIKAPV